MRKVMHKVKAQWVVVGIMGATTISLGTVDMHQVSGAESDSVPAVETFSGVELGTATVMLELSEQHSHIGIEHAINVPTTDGTATVSLYWNEDGTITVSVSSASEGILYSDLLADASGENTITVSTGAMDFYTIHVVVNTTREPAEQETLTVESVEEEIITSEQDESPEIEPETVVIEESPVAPVIEPETPAIEEETMITELDDSAAMEESPAAVESDELVIEETNIITELNEASAIEEPAVEVQLESTTATAANISETPVQMKMSLTAQSATYVQIITSKDVNYEALITRGTDGINTKPWGTEGFATIGTGVDYLNEVVSVSKEQLTDNGVTWALISLNGQELGWISKDALTVQNFSKIVRESFTDYKATISRGTDAINTQPFGVRGSKTVGSSADYIGKIVEVDLEQVTNYGVTWSRITLDGQELGWIARGALTDFKPYPRIIEETSGYYTAAVTRGTDAINTSPWGTKDFRTVAYSSDYIGKIVDVDKEMVMENRITWAHIYHDGRELGWIAKDALTVQDHAQIVSEKTVSYPAIISRGTDAINAAPWGTKNYRTIGSSADYVGKIVDVDKEQVTDYGVTWVHISLEGQELGWIAKNALNIPDYAQIVSEKVVSYPALISRGTDAINAAPWNTRGYEVLDSSAKHVGKIVDVYKEQETDYGVTWAQISLEGKIGWIAKDALTTRGYAHIVSEKTVAYPAVITRGTDAINAAPWGTKGYWTISSTANHVGKTVDVLKEQVTDYGVTWAQISLEGKTGWITKDALSVRNYAHVVSQTAGYYRATVKRGTDAINAAPWGTKGYWTIGTSAEYVGKTVDVYKEQKTDYGVTWAHILHDGKELGWIAKDALTVQDYAQIISEKAVFYPAIIKRGTDAINAAPWGTKGYRTLGTSADYVGHFVDVDKELVTDYGVTWVHISHKGQELGWVAKDALTVQNYNQIVSETSVSYVATIRRDTDAINGAPWGTKGYWNIGTSADYLGQVVEVDKELLTDYGVRWAHVLHNGRELGWIAKGALVAREFKEIISEKNVSYPAKINAFTSDMSAAPGGTKGYWIIGSSQDYIGKVVHVSKEKATEDGVTWSFISLEDQELGWVKKGTLAIEASAYYTAISEVEVDYPAFIIGGRDGINTLPWGTRGYQTIGTAADYAGERVVAIQEQVMAYAPSVTWVLVSLDGEELGWIAKSALHVQKYAQYASVSRVDYLATFNQETATIGNTPHEAQGYEIVGTSANHLGKTLIASKEAVMENGTTWVLVSLNDEELGWVEKGALAIQEYAQIDSILVTSPDKDSIILTNSTLRMATATPRADVVWSVHPGTGTATIDSSGLLTAGSAGTVTVKATAADGSGVMGSKIIEIAVPLSVWNYRGSELDLVIPEVIDGNDVTRQYNRDIRDYDNHYKSMLIDDYLESGNKGIVTRVGNMTTQTQWDMVIGRNIQLTSVTIPESVVTIGNNAFSDDKLTDIIIPDSVKIIGERALYGNPLTSITIGSDVQIGENMLGGNNLFRSAYANGGAGTYTGTRDGGWVKIN